MSAIIISRWKQIKHRAVNVFSQSAAQVCREADGYQGHLVSPEFGLKRLIEDAMLLVLDPVVTAVHRVHLLLVEAARCAGFCLYQQGRAAATAGINTASCGL